VLKERRAAPMGSTDVVCWCPEYAALKWDALATLNGFRVRLETLEDVSRRYEEMNARGFIPSDKMPKAEQMRERFERSRTGEVIGLNGRTVKVSVNRDVEAFFDATCSWWVRLCPCDGPDVELLLNMFLASGSQLAFGVVAHRCIYHGALDVLTKIPGALYLEGVASEPANLTSRLPYVAVNLSAHGSVVMVSTGPCIGAVGEVKGYCAVNYDAHDATQRWICSQVVRMAQEHGMEECKIVAYSDRA